MECHKRGIIVVALTFFVSYGKSPATAGYTISVTCLLGINMSTCRVWHVCDLKNSLYFLLYSVCTNMKCFKCVDINTHKTVIVHFSFLFTCARARACVCVRVCVHALSFSHCWRKQINYGSWVHRFMINACYFDGTEMDSSHSHNFCSHSASNDGCTAAVGYRKK